MEVRGYNPRQTWWSHRLIWIVLAIVVIAGGAWIWLRSNGGPTTNLETRTASWASYSNSGFGLTLKYPPSSALSASGTTLAAVTAEGAESPEVEVIVYSNPGKIPLDQWIGLEFPDGRLTNVAATSVGGMEGLKALESQEEGEKQHHFVATGERVFEIVLPSDANQEQQDVVATVTITPAPDPAPQATNTVVLDGVAYKVLFDSTILPGTEPITQKPSITGDASADARIQQLGEARGYRLRSTPTVGLSSADGYALQTEAATAWKALKAAAAAEGYSLSVTSGYRSIDEQRGIFMGRLNALGANKIGRAYTNEELANGTADSAIDEILKTSSIPGYSRHHTGFTVDIGHDGHGAFENFAGTPGHTWISKDNYANAKRFGFIPSYPDGAGLQGPDPEPWEYVWIGSNFLQANE